MNKIQFFIFVVLLTTTLTRAQTTDVKNLESIYQEILDDELFVERILYDSSYLCAGTLVHIPTHDDSTFNLTFNGKAVIKFPFKGIGKEADCARMLFGLQERGMRRYEVRVEVIKLGSGNCSDIKTIKYTCFIRKKGDLYRKKRGRISDKSIRVKYL